MGSCEMGLQGVSTWLFFQLGAGKALLVEVRELSSRCWYCSILRWAPLQGGTGAGV